MAEILQFYQDKEQYFQILVEKYQKLSRQFSVFRLLWFTLWLAAIWFTTRYNLSVVIIISVFGLIGFVLLVVAHQKILAKKKTYELYLQLNQQEIKVLNHDFAILEDGQEFIDENHFYSHDLDVFGPFSLFQYLNRCFSPQGKGNLAKSLQFAMRGKKAIEEQQEAVLELTEHPEWIQEFQVLGQQTKTEKKGKISTIELLGNWAIKDGSFKSFLYKILVILIPISSWIVFVLLLLGQFSATGFLLYMLIPLGFSGMYARKINENHMELGKQSDLFQKWKDVFDLFETKTFHSVALQSLQNELKTNEESAATAINKLAKISQAFDTRLNLIGWFLLNYFFSWDIMQSIRLEAWREKYGHHVNNWFETLAKVETLISFATLKFNRPNMVFPEISEEKFVFQAQDAGHVLLKEEGRVDNPIEFSGLQDFNIVTGANMAGKSTYLRTVGSNMILALAGAPVCAKEMKISPIQLYTSIRTKDSLAKNESYFYAELLRLQHIIEELKKGEPLFIILDEILKGTNSKDKEMGSKALVAQLIELNAVGLIATHDLQLGSLIDIYPDYIKNKCFEVDIHDGQLQFDYKLREGISKNLNATFLMKKMGITGVGE